MKFFTKRNLPQKIMLSIMIILLLFFSVPQYTYCADDDGGWIGSLLKEMLQLLDSLGDIVIGLLNNVMLGADGMGSAMLDKNDINVQADSGSWLNVGQIDTSSEGDIVKVFTTDEINSASFFGVDYEIPNMLYSPENIFANNIAALDVNFLRQNEYEPINTGSEAQEKAESSASVLKNTIASWYNSFRNIAVVGLLSVLIYLGIRILISSTAADKAKYKEMLTDWFVALCLVFVIHFIMSGILMLTDRFTELFATSINRGIVVDFQGTGIQFRTNLMGLVRFQAQAVDWQTCAAYSIIYIALVIYTCIFTFMYFKRFLYMAFFTMIAPLVALTYPIDRAGDGKSQAFNMWFKEYTMNAIIQPVHLILYTVFVSSAMELATRNLIYSLVAIGFLIPAEKFIKKMFGLDKAETTSGFGSFAGGAVAMSGLKQLSSLAKGNSKGGSGGKSSSEETDNSLSRITGSSRQTLGAFGGPDSPENESGENINTDNHNTDNYNTESDNNEEEQTSTRTMGGGTSEQEMDNSQTDMPETNNPIDTPSANIPTNNVPQKNPHWRRKLAIAGAKKGLKGVWKGAKIAATVGGTAMGAVGGGALGMAAGITTGDFSKTLQYAATGAGAGLMVGKGLGKGVGKIPGGVKDLATGVNDTITQSVDNARFAKDEAQYGSAIAKQRQNQAQERRQKEKYMKDKKQLERAKEMAAKIYTNTGKTYDAKEIQAAMYDYEKSNIADEKKIEKGLTMEANHGGINGNNHEKVMDIMDLTQKYGEEYIMDDKKRAQMERLVKSKVKGKNQQKEVLDLFAEAHGKKGY